MFKAESFSCFVQKEAFLETLDKLEFPESGIQVWQSVSNYKEPIESQKALKDLLLKYMVPAKFCGIDVLCFLTTISVDNPNTGSQVEADFAAIAIAWVLDYMPGDSAIAIG